MAILSKIRERSLALIAVIGLALFAFVLDPSTITDFFNSSKINEIGEVDGETISRQEFSNAVENYKSSNRSSTEMQASNAVWNNLLRDKIYTKQLEDAGITLGESDVWNAIISNQFIQNNQQFKNEIGLFDEDKFKLFLNDLKNSEDQSTWLAWNNFMTQIGNNLKNDTYNGLVNAGLGASLKEGEFKYKEDNTSFSADFVYIPFTTIADSLVTVNKNEIENYIQENKNKFKVETSRDIQFVKFDITATTQDKEDIKNEVGKLLEDRKEYSNVTKNEETIPGLKNATDYETFFQENGSDLPFSESYFLTADLPKVIAAEAETKKENETFGPYEDGRFFKISKVTEVLQKPDSVKSSYILIPFVGSQAANDNTTKTEAQAKKSADSILKLVRYNKEKFAEVASVTNTDASKDRGGELGWTRYSQAFSPNFDKDYADFIYSNRKGKVGLVKTKFGFHIIRVDDAKKKKKIMKVVTFGREILPSENTENDVFQKVENFSLDITSKNLSLEDAAKEKGYAIQPAVGLGMFEERVPGLNGNNREIVTWAFNKDTEIGKFKRFDVDKGYVVAVVTKKTEEGTKSADQAINSVRPILSNEKKAALIAEKMKGATLQDIATANNTSVGKMNNVSLKSPSIPGAGLESKVVGSMFYAKENELYNKVVGANGVFAYIITKREEPPVIPNYSTYRQTLANERRNKTVSLYNALKSAADIEDNRAFYYGIEN